MDIAFWSALSLTATMSWVTWQSRRIGTERRDVILLGVVTVLLAVGVVFAAVY